MRRRIPWWVLAFLFVVVPVVEIYLLIQVGQVIGGLWTVLVVIATGVLGSMLVRREGARAWRALRETLAAHKMPAKELADGALILIGGTLLLTPGFVTDAVGLFCILPLTRALARRALVGQIARRFVVVGPGTGFGPGAAAGFGGPGGPGGPGGAAGGPGQGADPRTGRRPGTDDSVVRGEVIDDQP